jgi:hypothetical protein
MQKTLNYTALTSAGEAFDIAFPLHPHTRSPDQVARLLTALLAAISAEVESGNAVSDGDVLQSLAMALAIRTRMVDAPPAASRALIDELLGKALAALAEARCYPAARA